MAEDRGTFFESFTRTLEHQSSVAACTSNLILINALKVIRIYFLANVIHCLCLTKVISWLYTPVTTVGIRKGEKVLCFILIIELNKETKVLPMLQKRNFYSSLT